MIITPKDFDFEGLGRKGFGFEEKGYQERNLGNLLKSLSKKKTQEAVKDLSEIEPESWLHMSSMVSNLVNLKGGTGTDLDIIGDLTSTIKDTLKTELDAALAPLKNEIMSAINTGLDPFMPAINEAVGGIASMISFAFDGLAILIGGFKEEDIEAVRLKYQDFIYDYLKERQEWFYGTIFGKEFLNQRYGIDLDTLDEQAAAGGVYSGQFDIDLDALMNWVPSGLGDYDAGEDDG